MDLYHNLNNDDEFINYFCDLIEDAVSKKIGYNISVGFKKHDMSIFFFIDGSTILQVMPNQDAQYTYANSPTYQNEVEQVLNTVEIQYKRDKRIEEIIKKES